MTITLYRSRWQVYHGEYPAVDTFEWSFRPVEPTRSVGQACKMIREPDGELRVVTPALARMVEVGERRVARLAFHGEDGLDAESVASLAAKGERGFRVSEDDAMAKKSDQPNLFGDPEPDGPTGAYGRRRSNREDRVTPVAEELKAYQEMRLDEAAIAAGAILIVEKKPGMQSIGECLDAAEKERLCREACGFDPPSPKRLSDHPRLKAELYEPCQICGGTQTIPPETGICVDPPDMIVKAERRADGSIVCPFCDRGFVKTGLTVAKVERWRAVIDEAEALARERRLDPTKASKPTSPKQAAIDGAGVDLVADVDAAIEQIRAASGITAIRILERVRDVLAKGRGTG